MGSTGKLVVSYEVDPPSMTYNDELENLEQRIKDILTPFSEAFDEMSEDRSKCLIHKGNTFIFSILNMTARTFNNLLESLITASTDGWLLIYGGLDGDKSIMLEIQNEQVITERVRRLIEDLNDYSDDLNEDTSEIDNDVPF